ncbi:hypothetical protein [Clostridium amazonitimonense]|uniref:hypothetical protein n=1 Tax=Clostridium amazonitimonense TaxID=1499689 RepID=UPI000509E0B2|nr:hypothetical protein [Clostridium amazonitimonense]
MIQENQLLKKKIKIQQVKNKLKLLNGIEILETFENDENRRLNEMFSDYYPVMCSNNTLPHSKLSFESSDLEIFSWISSEMRLENGQEYFFLCNGIWTRIRIIDLQWAIKSLWEHNRYKQGKHKIGSFGFLLMEVNLNYIMEAGCDSRDEYNYLIDIWACAK